MAATLAGLIRGRDVVQDAQALMQVAAHQLDVQMLSFSEVITLLEEAEYVQGVTRVGGKITSFTETVPYWNDLYGGLGQVWRDRQPTELEQQILLVVDGLSRAPVPLESLEDRFGLDSTEVDKLVDIGTSARLIQTIRTVDGDIAFSPFFGFENPEQISQLVLDHGTDQLIDEFDAVRKNQGLELAPGQYPLLTQAVAAGLVMAPSVRLPNGENRAFAALPFASDSQFLTTRKPVLEKALAVLACLRTAELYAEYNTLTPQGLVNVIGKLLDPNRGFLNPNSAHSRQYELMRNAGIIVFGPDSRRNGNWVTPTFVNTDDNREALIFARDLILHGEFVEHRVEDSTARGVLEAGQNYSAPMQTVHRLRDTAPLSPANFEILFNKALGLSPL